MRDLLATLDLRRRSVRGYAWVLALGLYPAVLLLGRLVTPAAGGGPRWLAWDVLLTFAYLTIGGGGLEEPGWRGLALPRLQQRYSPLRASMALALMWGAWHWPYFWAQGALGSLLGLAIYTLQEVAPLAVWFTAVYNLTGGSLPVAILLHASVNLAAILLPPTTSAVVLWWALMVALAVWMGLSPRTFALRHVEDGPHATRPVS